MENYAQRIGSYVSNTAKGIAACALAGAMLFGGCKTAKPSELELKAQTYQTQRQSEQTQYNSKKDIKAKLDYIETVLGKIAEDKKIEPAKEAFQTDEISTILQQTKRLTAIKKELTVQEKATPAELALCAENTARLSALETTANLYLSEAAQKTKGYAIIITQENQFAGVRVFGLYKDDHMELSGTLAEHAGKLNIGIEDVMQRHAVGSFGYGKGRVIGAGERDEIVANTVEVPRENWTSLTDFFPNGELRNEAGERITAGTFKELVEAGKVITVRLAYNSETAKLPEEKPAEKPAEEKPAEPEKPAEEKPAELPADK